MKKSILTTTLLSCLLLSGVQTLPAQETMEKRVSELEKKVQSLESTMKTVSSQLKDMSPVLWRSKDYIPNARIDLSIMKGDWGAVAFDSVGICLYSVSVNFLENFPNAKCPVIKVQHETQAPITFFQLGPEGERMIGITSRDCYWGQYSYQFAHELCHAILMATDSPPADQQTAWFDEVICETASFYTLRRMSETWKTNAPRTNWVDFAPHLKEYIDDSTIPAYKKEASVPEGKTFAQWFKENEAAMKATCDRPRNAVIAERLSAMFEKSPSDWEAIIYMRKTPSKTFDEFLQNWLKAVPEKHKPFVKQVMTLFEVPAKG